MDTAINCYLKATRSKGDGEYEDEGNMPPFVPLLQSWLDHKESKPGSKAKKAIASRRKMQNTHTGGLAAPLGSHASRPTQASQETNEEEEGDQIGVAAGGSKSIQFMVGDDALQNKMPGF